MIFAGFWHEHEIFWKYVLEGATSNKKSLGNLRNCVKSVRRKKEELNAIHEQLIGAHSIFYLKLLFVSLILFSSSTQFVFPPTQQHCEFMHDI